MTQLETAEGIVAPPQVELRGPGPQPPRLAEVLVLHDLRLVVEIGRGVLHEAGGGAEKELLVSALGGDERLEALQPEGQGVAHELRIVVGGVDLEDLLASEGRGGGVDGGSPDEPAACQERRQEKEEEGRPHPEGLRRSVPFHR